MTVETAERIRLAEEDILVVTSSGSAGHVGRPSLVRGLGSTHLGFSNFLLRLRVRRDEMVPTYVFWFLASDLGRQLLMALSRTTSGLRNLNVPRYLILPVPEPPRPIQAVIGGAAIEALELRLIAAKVQERLDLLPVAQLTAKLPGGLQDLPREWHWSTLGAQAEMVSGVTFTPEDRRLSEDPGAVPVLTTKNVQTEVDWDVVDYLDRSVVPAGRWLRAGDILISTSNSREQIGKMALVRGDPPEATFGSFIAALRCTGTVSPAYLHFWLSLPPIKALIRLRARQTTNIANLSKPILDATPVLVPPNPERESMDLLLNQVAALTTLMTGLEDRLRCLPDAFMSWAVE